MPVDEDRPDVEVAERTRHPLCELLCRERDEATTHRALARAASLDTIGERFERARVLPCRDADRHLLESAHVERVSARELCPRVERHFAPLTVDDARALDPDAATTECELAPRRPSAHRHARRIVLVALAAELRALGLKHRGHRLQPELVHEGEEVAPHERRERDQQLRPDRGLVRGRFLGSLLHGGSFRVQTPRFPRGRVEPPPSSFSNQRDEAALMTSPW
jgi:hypothetical protein